MSNQYYVCPKCQNTLLYSNKMLHDLRCSAQMPATYDNILSQNIYSSYNGYTNYNNNLDPNNLVNSGLRRSANPGYSRRISYLNDDGTTTEIRKDTNMSGKEELLAITYDPQGNVITRKKADGGSSNVKFSFHEMQDYSSYDPFDNYNIYEGGSVYVQTIPVESYVPTYQTSDIVNVTTYPYEHYYGSQGYTFMNNNINGVNVDDILKNNTSPSNLPSSVNEDLNKYLNTNSTNNNNYSNNNNYNNNNYNYNNYNYIQNTSTNTYQTGVNNNNFQQFAHVTKLDNNINYYTPTNNVDMNSISYQF